MGKIGIELTYINPTNNNTEKVHFKTWQEFGNFVSDKFEKGTTKQQTNDFREFVGKKLKRITEVFWTVDLTEYIPQTSPLTYTTYQKRYCGTTYTVENIPENFTDEQIIKACGVSLGWWVSGFTRRGNTARFNVNYD